MTEDDRVLSGAADGRLYRVIAGAAHSWAFLLVEDQLGERFLLDTDHRALAPVSDIETAGLLESRTYRQWNGPSRFMSVADLSRMDTRPHRADDSQLPIDRIHPATTTD